MPNELTPRSPDQVVRASYTDVLDAFLEGRNARTMATYEAGLKDFARFLGVRSPADAIEHLLALGHGEANRQVLAYSAHLKHRKLAAATIANRLAAIRSMVKVARMIGRIVWTIDVESPRVVKYRDTAGPGAEGFAVLEAKAQELAALPEPPGDCLAGDRNKRDLALLLLFYDLGLRRGEAVALDLADVDFEASVVWVIGKGKTDREAITLPGPTGEALKAWIIVRGDHPGPLFVRLDPGSLGYQRLTGEAVRRIIAKLSKQAGLSKPTKPHGIRHAAITRADELTNGNNTMTQRFSRHADKNVLYMYLHNRRDDAGEVARLLAADRGK